MTGGERSWRRFADAAFARVQRLVSWCQGAPLPPSQWSEPGVPVLLGLPLYVMLPFTLSAPLRFILGWSLAATLPLALLASALALAPVFVAWRRLPRPAHPLVAWALPSLVAAASVLALYRRDFAGLTNYAGADGGVHVFQLDWFVHHGPGIYAGFVSMYSFQYWIERIAHCNVYWSLCVAYYFGVAVVAAVPCVIALVVLEPLASRRAWWIGAGVCLVAALALAWLVVLPQQHYHQTDGFFAHLFSLVPLLVGWLIDAAARARLWRWLGLAATLILYRYTYALNLADLSIALAALFVADSFAGGVPALARHALRAAPLPLGAAALLFLKQLEPQLVNYGWIVPYDLPRVVGAQAFVVAALVIGIVTSPRESAAERPLGRALRFPLAFVAVNAVLTWVGWRLPHREPYYVYKYPLHAVVLAAGAVLVLVSAVAARFADALERRAWTRPTLLGAVGVALSGLAVLGWYRGYAPLRPMFRERVLGHPPYALNRPLADLAAWSRIDRVLRDEHKKFGGYITSYWPMFNFMNAALGYYNGGRAFWDHGAPRAEPGYCVFWDRGKVDAWSRPDDLPFGLRLAVSALNRSGAAACVSYRAYWNHAVERTLCHVCR